MRFISTNVNMKGMLSPMDVPTIESCCAPLAVEAIEPGQAEQLAAGFRVLSDPVRVRLLSLIATSPGGEACVCDLVAPSGRSQPTVSHHLGILADAGLIRREQRGKWAWFAVVPERLDVLRKALAV